MSNAVFSGKDKQMFAELLRTLTDEQRLEFIQSIKPIFCFYCGSLRSSHPCRCEPR